MRTVTTTTHQTIDNATTTAKTENRPAHEIRRCFVMAYPSTTVPTARPSSGIAWIKIAIEPANSGMNGPPTTATSSNALKVPPPARRILARPRRLSLGSSLYGKNHQLRSVDSSLAAKGACCVGALAATTVVSGILHTGQFVPRCSLTESTTLQFGQFGTGRFLTVSRLHTDFPDNRRRPEAIRIRGRLGLRCCRDRREINSHHALHSLVKPLRFLAKRIRCLRY